MRERPAQYVDVLADQVLRRSGILLGFFIGIVVTRILPWEMLQASVIVIVAIYIAAWAVEHRRTRNKAH